MIIALTANAIHYEIQPANGPGPVAHSRLIRFFDRPGAEQFISTLLQQNEHQIKALQELAGVTDKSPRALETALVEGVLNKSLLVTRGSSATGGGASRPPTAQPRPAPPKESDVIDGSGVLSATMTAYLKKEHESGNLVLSKSSESEHITPKKEKRPGKHYEAVVEVAGQSLSKKQSLQVVTPSGEVLKKYPDNDTKHRHRSLVRFGQLENAPVKLNLAIAMKGNPQPMLLPLHEAVNVHEKGTEKAPWDNVVVPVKPLQFLTPEQQKHQADLLQNGWLYVFWNGKLWRELKVSKNGVLQDVDLAFYRVTKEDQRLAEGHWLDAVWVPYMLNGQVQENILFAASAVQWSWGTISQFEKDPNQFSQHSANVDSLQSYQAKAEFNETATQSGALQNAQLSNPVSQRILQRQQRQSIAVAYLPKVGAQLKVQLKDDMGNLLSNVDFDLDLGGQLSSAKTDANGMLTVNIPNNLQQSHLHFYRKDKNNTVQQFSLKLNELPPVDTVKGLQARLNNLGFNAGPVDGISGRKTKAATREFQIRHQLTVDGISGPQTQQKLLAEHQS